MKKLGITIEEMFLLENISQFKNKMIEQGYDNNQVNHIVDQFIKLKDANRLPNDQKDIMKWYRKPFEEFEAFVSEIAQTPSKRQIKKMRNNPEIAEMRSADNISIIYDDNGVVAFAPNDFEASQYWGGNRTDWCVTKSENYWNDYIADAMFVYIFNFNREDYNIHTNSGDPLSKVALRLTQDGNLYEGYSADDNEIGAQGWDVFEQSLEEFGVNYSSFLGKISNFVKEHYDEFTSENWGELAEEVIQKFHEADSGFEFLNVEAQWDGEHVNVTLGGTLNFDTPEDKKNDWEEIDRDQQNKLDDFVESFVDRVLEPDNFEIEEMNSGEIYVTCDFQPEEIYKNELNDDNVIRNTQDKFKELDDGFKNLQKVIGVFINKQGWYSADYYEPSYEVFASLPEYFIGGEFYQSVALVPETPIPYAGPTNTSQKRSMSSSDSTSTPVSHSPYVNAIIKNINEYIVSSYVSLMQQDWFTFEEATDQLIDLNHRSFVKSVKIDGNSDPRLDGEITMSIIGDIDMVADLIDHTVGLSYGYDSREGSGYTSENRNPLRPVSTKYSNQEEIERAEKLSAKSKASLVKILAQKDKFIEIALEVLEPINNYRKQTNEHIIDDLNDNELIWENFINN